MTPHCWNPKTKPHLFCPGCGHGIALKQLGFAVDDLKLIEKVTLGIDIGCSLLAWDFFNFDTVQTHHGRSVPVMVGYKMAEPKRVALAYMGDGGAYAIGLQSLLHAAHRNDPITAIVINNANYGMTGGQSAPTTPADSPSEFVMMEEDPLAEAGFDGPMMVKAAAHPKAWVARASVSNPIQLKSLFKQAINHQIDSNSFAFLEVLSLCPTNWKTDAESSFKVLSKMEKKYPIQKWTTNNTNN